MSSGLANIFFTENKLKNKHLIKYTKWSIDCHKDKWLHFPKRLLLSNSFQSWLSKILEMMPFLRLPHKRPLDSRFSRRTGWSRMNPNKKATCHKGERPLFTRSGMYCWGMWHALLTVSVGMQFLPRCHLNWTRSLGNKINEVSLNMLVYGVWMNENISLHSCVDSS